MRLAFRVGDGPAMRAGVTAVLRATERSSGPEAAAKRRWAEAIARPGRQWLAELAAVGEEFERLLSPWPAANAYSDAALAAARSGRDAADLVARAQRLYDECEFAESPLGPLPETRWIAPAGVETAPSRSS